MTQYYQKMTQYYQKCMYPASMHSIPGYENHQFDQGDAATASMWPSLQCRTQRQDCGHTMRWGSDCILHIRSPSASEYAASATLGTHQLSRMLMLHSHTITNNATANVHVCKLISEIVQPCNHLFTPINYEVEPTKPHII